MAKYNQNQALAQRRCWPKGSETALKHKSWQGFQWAGNPNCCPRQAPITSDFLLPVCQNPETTCFACWGQSWGFDFEFWHRLTSAALVALESLLPAPRSAFLRSQVLILTHCRNTWWLMAANYTYNYRLPTGSEQAKKYTLGPRSPGITPGGPKEHNGPSGCPIYSPHLSQGRLFWEFHSTCRTIILKQPGKDQQWSSFTI